MNRLKKSRTKEEQLVQSSQYTKLEHKQNDRLTNQNSSIQMGFRNTESDYCDTTTLDMQGRFGTSVLTEENLLV